MQSGSILIDGVDLNAYNAKWLKRHMALVAQEPLLFDMSIRDNICLGLTTADGIDKSELPTDDDVMEAAELANAAEFIRSLNGGLDTGCGDKGSKVGCILSLFKLVDGDTSSFLVGFLEYIFRLVAT